MKIGDKVKLKSGSPIMTINEMISGDMVQVIWFSVGHPNSYPSISGPPVIIINWLHPQELKINVKALEIIE